MVNSSVSGSLSPNPPCATRSNPRGNNFVLEFFSRGLFTVTLNGQSERGNTRSLRISCFVMQKQFVRRRRFESVLMRRGDDNRNRKIGFNKE